MLLAFSRITASPTHKMKTLCTLNMRASTFDFAYSYRTSWIRTQLCALFQIQLCEQIFELRVFKLNLSHFSFKFRKQVDSVDFASLEGMDVFFAIKTEMKLAMLALSSVFRFLNVSNRGATLDRTPTNIIHLCDSIVKGELLIPIFVRLRKPHISDVPIVH